MTKYESLAITLSVIAIMIPLIKSIWEKWIVKPILLFHSTGRAYLYTNKSGSYIQVEGVYEAQNKPITVKKMCIKVIRNKDHAELNHQWSSFFNPTNQRILGAVASTTEIAHPFRIEANSVVCAFTEFSDFYNSSAKILKPYFDDVNKELEDMVLISMNYPTALATFYSSSSYKKLNELLKRECFWEISQYELTISVEYGNTCKEFNYSFEISKDIKNDIEHNLNEVIISPLKDFYRMPYDLKNVQVDLRNH